MFFESFWVKKVGLKTNRGNEGEWTGGTEGASSAGERSKRATIMMMMMMVLMWRRRGGDSDNPLYVYTQTF